MTFFTHNKTSFWATLGLVSSFFFSLPVYAEQVVELKVTGVKGAKLIENVNAYTAMLDKESADGSERYQQQVIEAIHKGLRTYGYYNVDVNFKLEPRQGKKSLLIAEVNMGDPVLLVEADVKLLGQAAEDKEFLLLEKKLPKKGSALNHEQYENYKSSLQKLAQTKGYFDAEFTTSRLEVMPSTYQGWWRIVFDSKKRYRFGQFTFSNSQIREDYLRSIIPFKEGDYYSINALSELTNDYSSSNWFGSVLPNPTLNEKEKRVDVDWLFQPRKKNAMDVGIGYSTDVGMRFQLGWVRPWINSRGHSFRSNFYLSSPKQTIEATYKIPLLKNPLRYYYELSTGLENEKDSKIDTNTTAATFAALRYWNRVTGWQHSFGMRVRYDSFTQGNVEDRTLLVYPTASAIRTRLRGGIFPMWGDSQRITVDVGHRATLSEVNFFKVQASTAWVRTLANHHRFLARAEIGFLRTTDIQRIPPALRFFAGGDRSVRGYGYKKISLKDRNGKLIGASRLLSGTIEYQYRLYPDWWLAIFADSGLAAGSYSTKELRYGAGFGLRWASPVGAIKLDIATPVRDKDNSKNVQFYIGLGSDL